MAECRKGISMGTIAAYISVAASVVMLALSLSSLYLRSRYFLWAIFMAGIIATIAAVGWELSRDKIYWYNIILYVFSYIFSLQYIAKKYSRRERFFTRSPQTGPTG